jgi:hypothetical protein
MPRRRTIDINTAAAEALQELAALLSAQDRDDLLRQLWADRDQYAADVAQLDGILVGLALRGAQDDDSDVVRARALLDIARTALADAESSLLLFSDAVVAREADRYWDSREAPAQT